MAPPRKPRPAAGERAPRAPRRARAAEPPGADRSAAPVPEELTLPALRDAAAGCRACDLWERGTQTVFGEGPPRADVVFVGEQPGDREDLEGRPFVGPAGKLLDRALEAAGISRDRVYVTNVVKHFKWEARGKRRIHQKPDAGEIRACRPWLDAELTALHPRAVVCLGATAAQALLGKGFRVTQHRREILEGSPLAPVVMATVHPSSILRAPDDEARRAGLQGLIDDLAALAKALQG